MENFGLIIYKYQYIAFDPNVSSFFILFMHINCRDLRSRKWECSGLATFASNINVEEVLDFQIHHFLMQKRQPLPLSPPIEVIQFEEFSYVSMRELISKSGGNHFHALVLKHILKERINSKFMQSERWGLQRICSAQR